MDDPSQMTIGLFGVVAAYVVLAGLLLSVNVAARWLWWIKAAAIVLTLLFFVQSYASVAGLIGWPTTDRLPERFQFLWATVVEPNRFYNEPGAVYMWAEPIGATDEPIGTPRAYRVQYTRALSDQIAVALAMIKEGKVVAGYARPVAVAVNAAPDAAQNAQARQDQRVSGLLPRNFLEEAVDVVLEELQTAGNRRGPLRF